MNPYVVPGLVLVVLVTVGPDRVFRYNLQPAADINGSAAPGISTGDALATMERLANETLPQGFGFEWTGLAFQEAEAGNTALFIFPLWRKAFWAAWTLSSSPPQISVGWPCSARA